MTCERCDDSRSFFLAADSSAKSGTMQCSECTPRALTWADLAHAAVKAIEAVGYLFGGRPTYATKEEIEERLAGPDERHPHLINGEFQSDKYPTCPRGKVPLSTKDVTAQDLLWEYAQRRRAIDADFATDLETVLKTKGYTPVSDEPVAKPAQSLITAARALHAAFLRIDGTTRAASMNSLWLRLDWALRVHDAVTSEEEEPYCDVCGRSGSELFSAVEVCRDCYHGVDYNTHAEIAKLRTERDNAYVQIANLTGKPSTSDSAPAVPKCECEWGPAGNGLTTMHSRDTGGCPVHGLLGSFRSPGDAP